MADNIELKAETPTLAPVGPPTTQLQGSAEIIDRIDPPKKPLEARVEIDRKIEPHSKCKKKSKKKKKKKQAKPLVPTDKPLDPIMKPLKALMDLTDKHKLFIRIVDWIRNNKPQLYAQLVDLDTRLGQNYARANPGRTLPQAAAEEEKALNLYRLMARFGNRVTSGGGGPGRSMGITKPGTIVPRSGELRQKDLEHIVVRHWPTSDAKNAGKFSKGTTARDLKKMINETLANGKIGPNTKGRPGHIFEHTFNQPIGVNSAGKLSKTLRLIRMPNGTVKTAFPI